MRRSRSDDLAGNLREKDAVLPAGEVRKSRPDDLADNVTVKEAMLTARASVAQCWNEAVVRRTGIGGARTLRFRIDDSGAVTHVWVASAGESLVAADFLLDRCLVAALRSVRFPPPSGDGVYTWVFEARP